MEDISKVLQIIMALFAMAGFISGVVGVLVYSKTKGTIDALTQTVNTWKGLAEAQTAEVEQLKKDRDDMKDKVAELRGEIKGRDQAAILMTRYWIEGVAQSGVCLNAWGCENRRMPEADPDGNIPTRP